MADTTAATNKRSELSSTDGSEETDVWYLALKKLHIVQGPHTTPSSLRIQKGQRFALDGDEPVDIADLIRLGAVKLYEESDEAWAQAELANAPKPRRRNRG